MARDLDEIRSSEIEMLTEKYGAPRTLSFSAEFQEFECEMIRRSLAKDRNNDVTCFIRREDGNFVVIQKHQYARSGIYRAPSGGARRGESIEEAAHREMREETGLEIELLRFLLDLSLEVKCGEETLQWRSLVFLARPTGGEMRPIDTREIFDVQAMTREALLGPVDRLMRESGWGGFAYRSFLTREFFKRLDELNI